MRLTTTSIGTLKLDAGVADKIVFDADVPGFGIRIRASGARTWIYQYKLGGRTRRLVLGQVSAIKLAKARDIAADLHAKVRLGGDPASEKRENVRQANNTFGVLVERFLDQYRARPRTVAEVQRYLRRYASPLHPAPLGAISLRDIADLLAKVDKATGPATANRMRASLSACFSWGMREGLATANPVINTNKREERTRDRVLSNDELRRVWNAAGDDAFGTIVKLLILTGQRRNEIGELSWSEIDFTNAVVNLPSERTKNKRPHIVPLANTARSLLGSWPRTGDKVFGDFASWSYAKRGLDARGGVTSWTLHDLRRTTATGMAELGIGPHIVEAVINHVSGHKGGVAGIYNRSSYAAEKAAALARWDAHVSSTVGTRDGES
jgi:integrase